MALDLAFHALLTKLVVGSVLAEYDDFLGNSVKYQYIYAGSQKIAMVDASGNVLYYLNDHLGSARVVCDESGVIVDQFMPKPI